MDQEFSVTPYFNGSNTNDRAVGQVGQVPPSTPGQVVIPHLQDVFRRGFAGSGQKFRTGMHRGRDRQV